MPSNTQQADTNWKTLNNLQNNGPDVALCTRNKYMDKANYENFCSWGNAFKIDGYSRAPKLKERKTGGWVYPYVKTSPGMLKWTFTKVLYLSTDLRYLCATSQRQILCFLLHYICLTALITFQIPIFHAPPVLWKPFISKCDFECLS